MQAPTPQNYVEWYNQRIMRTTAVAAAQNRITGRQVKDENLSVKLLYDLGFTLDPITDALEKKIYGRK